MFISNSQTIPSLILSPSNHKFFSKSMSLKETALIVNDFKWWDEEMQFVNLGISFFITLFQISAILCSLISLQNSVNFSDCVI